jgi:hypothetical protein
MGPMTDDALRTSPAWQRFQAVRTLAHHATDAADLATLLDVLGLTAAEGRVPPTESPTKPQAEPRIPEQEPRQAPLADDSAERLSTLLRDTLPSTRHGTR